MKNVELEKNCPKLTFCKDCYCSAEVYDKRLRKTILLCLADNTEVAADYWCAYGRKYDPNKEFDEMHKNFEFVKNPVRCSKCYFAFENIDWDNGEERITCSCFGRYNEVGSYFFCACGESDDGIEENYEEEYENE